MRTISINSNSEIEEILCNTKPRFNMTVDAFVRQAIRNEAIREAEVQRIREGHSQIDIEALGAA